MTLPARIPSSESVSAAADTLASALDALDDVVLDVTTSWSGLSAVYSAPEADIAYGALAPLNPETEALTTALSSAVSALRTYAEALSTLETRRTAILADMSLLSRTDDPQPGDPTEWEVRAARTAFDADAAAADEDCARALRALRLHFTWDISNTLDPFTGTPGGILQGLAGELLQRYRGTLMVPGPGALIPNEIRLSPSSIHPTWPREIRNGQTWVQRPSGFWVLESNLLPDGPLPATNLPGWNGRPQFTGTPQLGAPPAWAGHAGRALSVAGAGLTYWSVYSESYNDTLTRHPDWTDEQRQQEALVDSAVVGTASVAGGAGGAWAGAAGGAAIGSIFPGPGTLIGGIIGGIAGGIGGGWLGGAAAQEVVDGVRGDYDGDEMIMAPGPLGVPSEPTGPML